MIDAFYQKAIIFSLNDVIASLTLALLVLLIICNNLMQEKLPRLSQLDGKRSSHIINRHRIRKLILKRYDYVNHSLPLPDLALHQLIAMSVHNLAVLPKKKPLCDSVPIDVQRHHPSICNKKVLIFKHTDFEEKENKFGDLKTCKSLLNPKMSPKKKLISIFNPKRSRTRYNTESIHSLWDITDRNVTDPLKRSKNEDFQLQPWGSEQNEKQSSKYRA